MSPIYSEHLGQDRFAARSTNGCTSGDKRSRTTVGLTLRDRLPQRIPWGDYKLDGSNVYEQEKKSMNPLNG
jgi:hypothetical protein